MLLTQHSQLVDRTVKALWGETGVAADAALVATGGYGRAELFPCSDIDLLVLLGAEPTEAQREALERLIGRFWDIGLEIGHSVRTVEGCVEAAAGDITIRTTLLESRFLAGSRKLYQRLDVELQKVLDPVAFFKAKKLEQEQRHAKHHDSPYSLEPNLKEAPGGLRDLQVIQWIARAAGITEAIGPRWGDLVKHGLIERGEARQLAKLESHLQDLRIRLHYLASRREDRLVFDLQTALAAQLGHKDTAARRASEAMMQRYYQTAQGVTQLNTILLQNFEALLAPRPDTAPRPLNERFEVRSELLHIKQENTFARSPTAILECFLLMMQHQELRGMTARTLAGAVASSPACECKVSKRCHCEAALSAHPAAAARHRARVPPHEPVRRARPLPARVRPHRRADAARPVPRLHRRPAHPDGDAQPAAPHHAGIRARVSAVRRAHGGLRAALAAVYRGALPRHRQGPRRRPLRARGGGRAQLFKKASPFQRGRRSGRVPGRAPPRPCRTSRRSRTSTTRR